jgi:flagellar motor switch protein FliN/FliY
LANHTVVLSIHSNPAWSLRPDFSVPTLDKVSVDLMVVLGTTSMPVHQVLRLSRGAIIELDATEADEVKILANNLPIASGMVLVNRNRIAVEVKQMLPRSPDHR